VWATLSITPQGARLFVYDQDFTRTTTLEILRKYFPNWDEKTVEAPVTRKTQTIVLGNTSGEQGEVDIILTNNKTSFISKFRLGGLHTNSPTVYRRGGAKGMRQKPIETES